MPRFIKFQIDWPIHAKVNNDILDQSAHGKNETPKDCTCDFCYEQFCIASVDEGCAANSSSNVPISKILVISKILEPPHKEIEDRREIPEVRGCNCDHCRCNIHQFQSFWREHQQLIKKHSKLIDDCCSTLKLSQHLEDLQFFKKRHDEFRNRLSDAGIHPRYQKRGNVNILSLVSSKGWLFTPPECRIKRSEQGERLLWAKNF
ncbi:hypothetical protein BGAL_0056g00190 [Botrytis galanthina]|uniref:Uncharacterized protein n=1 Tax=Botrytis galanthina TaxID=278940 RepID=A0A4S8R8B8_9HELO|nr:hypothetical protein BGAL_0056g00190 [Botrytis galanthina]